MNLVTMHILDYEAVYTLLKAVIAQAYRDASGKGTCPIDERQAALTFLAELQDRPLGDVIIVAKGKSMRNT